MKNAWLMAVVALLVWSAAGCKKENKAEQLAALANQFALLHQQALTSPRSTLARTSRHLKRFAKYPAGGGGHSKLIYEHSRRRVLRKALLRRFPVDTL